MIGKFTLGNFYKSDEWFELTKAIKLARTNPDGSIICAHCGKPIIKAYDCICHHDKIYLTEDNVNDYDISLNPDNIILVHHKCHNLIHNKLGYIHKEIYLVYGSPLSGKTSYVKSVMNPGDLIVDLDNIWECVSGQARYVKPAKLNAVVFGMRDLLLEMIRTRTGKWDNAYIVGGYPLISERERMCRLLGAKEIYIDSDKETCLERLKALDKDDSREFAIWSKFIDDWWEKAAPGLPKR